MEQCRRCKYLLIKHNDWYCRFRVMQRCRHENNRQTLEMVPGMCRALNPQDDCVVFGVSWRVWIREMWEKVQKIKR